MTEADRENEYAWRVELPDARVGCSSRSVAYQVVTSLLPLLHKSVVIQRYDGEEWRLYERVEADDPPLAVVLLARWKALKDYLTKAIDADNAVHSGFIGDGELALAAPFGGLLSANRSTLAKMTELEAGNA